MIQTMKTRMLAITAGVILAVGFAQAAHAEISFTNDSDNQLKFGLRCDGSGNLDQWTIAPHSTKDLYCINHSNRATVVILTDHGDHSERVRARVYDGNDYVLYYDNDGDVNIRSAS